MKKCIFAAFVTVASLAMASESPSPAPADTRFEVTPIGNFDANLQHWDYKGGELKGAKGALTREEGAGRHGAAAKLTADFSQGGSYVAMRKGFKARANEIHFWIKAPGCTAVGLRLGDSSKRTFQYTRELADTDDWQLVTLRDFDQADGCWSAPDKEHPEGRLNEVGDNHFQLPARSFSIMIMKEKLRKDGKMAAAFVDDVEIVAPPVVMLPPHPMPARPSIPPGSFFGVNCHWLHSDIFGEKVNSDPYDRVEYTLPFVVEGGFGVVRDVLYQGPLTETDQENDPSAKRPGLIWPYLGTSKERCEANRRQVETYLDMYSKAGVRVLLCPFFLKASDPGFQSLFEWVGHLAKTYPCIAGIEMHNEPSLRVFWIDTPADYAEACREGSKIIKALSPSTPIYVGCISHMWWKPGLKWLQDALDHGLLEGADGISVHPYRMKSPPEGGSQHAADDDPNGFVSEAADWWGMIQRYNTNGKPLRLTFTEVGYSTGGGIAGLGGTEQAKGVSVPLQADYVSRLALLAFDMRQRGLPIDEFCWYDLKCDGEGDPTDLQANFGLIDYAAQAPRPSFLAYSRIAKTFGAISDFVPLDAAQSFSVHPEAVKSMAWQRLSDGAILVAFWRLDQVATVADDFDARLSLALPSGFQAEGVDVVDLHPDTLAPAPFTAAGDHAISVPVRVTTRAAWIVVHPRSPHAMASDAKWSEGLPAACEASGEAGKPRIELSGPRQAPPDAQVPLVLTVDNTAGTKAVSGFITLSGHETQFSVPSGDTTHVDLSLPVAKGGNARVAWYTICVGDHLVGRGGFTVFDEAAAPSIPPAKDR